MSKTVAESSDLSKVIQYITIAEKVRYKFEEITNEYQVSMGGYQILGYIKTQAELGGTNAEIAKQLGVSRAAVSRRCRSLTKQGLLKRINDHDDLRLQHFKITTKGEQVFYQIQEIYTELIDEGVRRYQIGEFTELNRLIDQCNANKN